MLESVIWSSHTPWDTLITVVTPILQTWGLRLREVMHCAHCRTVRNVQYDLSGFKAWTLGPVALQPAFSKMLWAPLQRPCQEDQGLFPI